MKIKVQTKTKIQLKNLIKTLTNKNPIQNNKTNLRKSYIVNITKKIQVTHQRIVIFLKETKISTKLRVVIVIMKIQKI